MELKLDNEFFYRVVDENLDLKKTFNAWDDGIKRNNPKLKFYNGEWVKIKVSEFLIHIVKPTETISGIAEMYNIAEEKLILDNNIKHKVFIGQILKIDTQKIDSGL